MELVIAFDLLLILIAVFFIRLAISGAANCEDVNDFKRLIRTILVNPPNYRRYKSKRLELLNKNSDYLQKYEDIWKEQILIKPDLEIELKIKVIYIRDKRRIFKFRINDLNTTDNIWNIMLDRFQECNYDSMLKAIKDSATWEWSSVKYEEKDINKVDINNCTEKELSDLPCISLIVAKKLVKYRQKIEGFKNQEEFFEYLG